MAVITWIYRINTRERESCFAILFVQCKKAPDFSCGAQWCRDQGEEVCFFLRRCASAPHQAHGKHRPVNYSILCLTYIDIITFCHFSPPPPQWQWVIWHQTSSGSHTHTSVSLKADPITFGYLWLHVTTNWRTEVWTIKMHHTSKENKSLKCFFFFFCCQSTSTAQFPGGLLSGNAQHNCMLVHVCRSVHVGAGGSGLGDDKQLAPLFGMRQWASRFFSENFFWATPSSLLKPPPKLTFKYLRYRS